MPLVDGFVGTPIRVDASHHLSKARGPTRHGDDKRPMRQHQAGSSDLDIAININDSVAIMSSNRHCDDRSKMLLWPLTDRRAPSMMEASE